MHTIKASTIVGIILFFLTACGSSLNSKTPLVTPNPFNMSAIGSKEPANPEKPAGRPTVGPQATAPRSQPRIYKIDALIYNGNGTAFGDVEAISEILDAHRATYQTASSEELNAMNLED